MKKPTKLFNLLTAVMLLLGAKAGYSQCSASFGYYNGGTGPVSFTSTSVLSNTANTTYYWNFGDGTTYSVTNSPGAFNTYTANGTYFVNLFIMSIAPTCSSTVTQTVVISGAPTGTCNLSAGFSESQGPNGIKYLNNNSTGTVTGTTYLWNFGDGSTATSFNGTHTYTANGTYTVSLTANNNYTASCVSTQSAVIVVNNICNLTPSFNYSVGAGGSVTFASTSTGVGAGPTYFWNFGNGSTAGFSPTLSTASTIYTLNGVYTINMMISTSSPTCFASTAQTINVTGAITPTCYINADFSLTHAANGAVNFNNTSTGTGTAVTYAWNFGDGNTSTSASPSHTYAANGNYTVTLTADNNYTASCVSNKTMVITVNSYCTLSAGFTYTLNANGNVGFSNTTSGATASMTSYVWEYGDGAISYGSPTSHVYTNGTYIATLTATNFSVSPACASSATQVITVTSSTCNPDASFSMTPSGTPQYWYAVPATSSVNVISAVWYWGDGATTSGLYSSHSYSVAGNYTICLSVTLTCSASATSCYTYYISRSADDNTIIHVEAVSPDMIATGIKTSEKNIAYTVSPNPGNGLFNVNISGLTGTKAKVNVYNMLGTLVLETEDNTSNGSLVKDINLENAASGVYFIKVTSNNKEYMKKLIISK